jgi:predicted deacetylase
MIPAPAQYLLRIDDLCPTIRRSRWEQYRKLIDEFGVRPILAVVPDNRDKDLNGSPADPEFWAHLRAMEAAGAAIAVHGYRHLCQSQGKSLLGLHRRTEFAGVDFEKQREWIRAGFGILRDHGLNPRLWIAPRHGFDRNTLRVLVDLGVEYISDGFARVPYRRYGINWIPQQLWRPMVKTKGLWTVCIHPYAASSEDVEGLERFLERHVDQVTSFDSVLKNFQARPLGVWERMYQAVALRRIQRRYRRRRKTARRR